MLSLLGKSSLGGTSNIPKEISNRKVAVIQTPCMSITDSIEEFPHKIKLLDYDTGTPRKEERACGGIGRR